MKDSKFMNKMARFGSKAKAMLSKNSPEILIAVGVIGGVASTVMACKATLKAPAILEEAKSMLEDANETQRIAEESADDSVKCDLRAIAKKDIAIIYAQTSLKYARLYAPATALGIASIVSIFASNNIMRKRNAAIIAAYAALDQGFKAYRKRVVDRFGTDVDNELRLGTTTVKHEDVIVDVETGKKKKVKTDVEMAGETTNDYIYYFTKETSTEWEPNNNYNMMTISARQQMANDTLNTREWFNIYDALCMLGMEKCCMIKDPKTGKETIDPKVLIVGWKRDGNGDGHIDFRAHTVYETDSDGILQPKIAMDFNVDGLIVDGI